MRPLGSEGFLPRRAPREGRRRTERAATEPRRSASSAECACEKSLRELRQLREKMEELAEMMRTLLPRTTSSGVARLRCDPAMLAQMTA